MVPLETYASTDQFEGCITIKYFAIWHALLVAKRKGIDPKNEHKHHPPIARKPKASH